MRSPSTGTVEDSSSALFPAGRLGTSPENASPVGGLRMARDAHHEPVLADEVAALFDPVPPGLVLDATVGQNALSQVEAFQRTAGVTGLAMTKLDGTARGGILVALAEKYKLPVHFIGVGEGVDDLAPFTARDFAQAIAGIET